MKMEFDVEQAIRLVKLLKAQKGELLAYRAVYEAVEQTGRLPDLESVLSSAKSAVQSEVDAKYDPLMKVLEKATDQASLDAARQFLATWIPKGKPN